MTRRHALILAAHGANDGSVANQQVNAWADSLTKRTQFHAVSAAFQLGTPHFSEVLDRGDDDDVTVVPVMTGQGYFSDVILPQQLQRNTRFSVIQMRITPALGTHRAIPEIVSQRVTPLVQLHNSGVRETAIIVIGHGTRRYPASRKTTDALAHYLRQSTSALVIQTAFLDEPPLIDDALATIEQRHVIVVPFLIGGGEHVEKDIPNRLGIASDNSRETVVHDVSGKRVLIDDPVGRYLPIEDIVLDLAMRARCVEPGALDPEFAAAVVHTTSSHRLSLPPDQPPIPEAAPS